MGMNPEQNLRQVLEANFGYDSFRPYQEEIIKDVLAGKDVLAVLATGGGKSLCYQLPAFLMGGLTIVISPLISLMKDQVDALRAKGIFAATINSTIGEAERSFIERGLLDDKIKILYISPEKAAQSQFIEFLKKLNLKLIAIDEAHCISMWGHQFRPEYRMLYQFKMNFPHIPIIALTATAIPEVRDDIVKQLRMKSPRIYVGSFNRKNIHYSVRPKAGCSEDIVYYINNHKGDQGIIYCHSKKNTEELAQKLRENGISAFHYNADLPDPIRSLTQEKFLKGDIQVVCATIAFGMGIDKPDVRFVIHHDIPKNIESYYQETGRAGRDGQHSECILYYSVVDAIKLSHLITHEYDDIELRNVAINKLYRMQQYCETDNCRRKYLLGYFGELYSNDNCESCDHCLNLKMPISTAKINDSSKAKLRLHNNDEIKDDSFDGTNIARKVIQCVKQLNGAYSASYIAKVICGSRSTRIIKNGHNHLPIYGTGGKKYTRKQWTWFVRELIKKGYLEYSNAEGKRELNLTEHGKIIENTKEHILFNRNIEEVDEEDEPYSEQLFETLRQLRREIADARGFDAYMVFSDFTLKEMARYYPCNEVEFLNISGVGQYKLKAYGPDFIALIKEFRQHKSEDKFVNNKPESQHLQSRESNDELDASIFEEAFKIQMHIEYLKDELEIANDEYSNMLKKIIENGQSNQGPYQLIGVEKEVTSYDSNELKKHAKRVKRIYHKIEYKNINDE